MSGCSRECLSNTRPSLLRPSFQTKICTFTQLCSECFRQSLLPLSVLEGAVWAARFFLCPEMYQVTATSLQPVLLKQSQNLGSELLTVSYLQIYFPDQINMFPFMETYMSGMICFVTLAACSNNNKIVCEIYSTQPSIELHILPFISL